MKKILFISVFGFLISLFFACEESDNNTIEDNLISKKGTVKYLGDIASDGCGWLINIDSVDYKPIELVNDFKINGLPVILEYEATSKSERCGFSSIVHNMINIVNIELDSTLLKQGLIKYFGDPAADGCGWIIEIENKDYSPINLPDSHETDSLVVNIIYELLKEKADCGFQIDAYDKLNIIYID